MAVNENIYGLKTQWQKYPYDSAWSAVDDINECIRVAYFGNYEPRYQTLAHGAENGMIDKSVPLDKSISYCGLGTESAYSHVKYYSNATLEPLANGDAITPFYTDNRTITNFAFMYGDIANGSGYGNSGGRYNTTDRACRYYPDADVENDYNNNRALTPVTSFKFTNFILLIRVKCCRGLDPSNAYYFNPENGADYTLYDYVNTNAHSDYPYVYCVYVVPYCCSSSALTRSPYPNMQRGQGIAILDSYDGAVDSNLQQPLYSYYYGQTSYSDPAFKIHGMLTGGGTQQSMQYHASAEEKELGYLAICPDTWSAFKYRTYGSYICMGVWREYDSTFWDECMEAVACFGCFFTDKIGIAQTGDLTSNDMYCGTLEKGIGHGKYTHGNDNADQPQFTADTNETEYDPYNPPSDTDTPYEGSTTRITGSKSIAVGGKWYCDSNVGKWTSLLNWCSSLDIDTPAKDQYFFGQNPIDCILEGKVIFVGDYTFGKIAIERDVNIELGSYTEPSVESNKFIRALPYTFDCGSVTINKIWGDFRDLPPFTSYTLILPFATAIELPAELVIGHTVNLSETIDPLSGDLKYHVRIDEIDYTSINGNCSMDLAINGLQIATYRQTRYDLQTQMQTSAFNAAASIIGGSSGALIAASYGNVEGALMQLGGGITNMFNSINQSVRAENKRAYMQPPVAKISIASSNVEWGNTVFPCIVASSPRMIAGYNQSEYKAKMGFATYTVATIGSQEGCVVCENVVLSGFKCSDSEQTRIKQMLEAGVYIKK